MGCAEALSSDVVDLVQVVERVDWRAYASMDREGARVVQPHSRSHWDDSAGQGPGGVVVEPW